ncbi:MAG: hypothetical protein NTX57_10845, partial [Armatimonadetes bacterium]|nr:hypothetical protein [Armatimonadota bacterium]
ILGEFSYLIWNAIESWYYSDSVNTCLRKPIMSQPHLAYEEIDRLGESIYKTKLRALLETHENIGRLVSIDVETSDYEVGDDLLTSGKRIRERHPNALLYGVRIGYNAVFAVGGTLERTSRL